MNVANKSIIRKLTMRFFRAGKTRNIIAVIAIVLTSVMFTSVFTIGGSMLAVIQDYTMRQVGTSAHGGLKYLTWEQYKNFANSPRIKEISYRKGLAVAENDVLFKEYSEISFAEDRFAEWMFSYPSTGRMPQTRNETACSTVVLDALGIPHEIGAKMTLEFSVDGEVYTEVFTLSGFWKGDLALPAQHIWVAGEYVDEIVSAHVIADDGFAGKIFADVMFGNSFDINGKMKRLVEERGYSEGEIRAGINRAYAANDMSEIDPSIIAIGLLVLALILFSGYLIIYSVFAISVNADIQFYGLLKTIGTTGKLLRRIIRGQALLLSAFGVPVGLLFGYLSGIWLTPVIAGLTSFDFTGVHSANPLIFVFAASFSLLTVFIGCRKPGKIAARVSPVEAVKYSGITTGGRKKAKKTRTVSSFSMAWANITREKRKLCVIVLSLSLTLILLNSAFSATQSFDMDAYMSEFAVSDFAVADGSLFNPASSYKDTEAVTQDFLDELAAMGIRSTGIVYFHADIEHELPLFAQDNFKAQFEAERAVLERYYRWSIPLYEAHIADGILPTGVYGFGRLPMESFFPDYDKLSSGNYAITQTHSDIPVYGVGDTILLTNKAGESREFEIIGVVRDFSYNLSARFGFIGQTIMLADNIYQEFFQPQGIMQVNFNADDEHISDIESWLAEYTTRTVPTLNYISRDTLKAEFDGLQTTYLTFGGAMSFILALIGVLNFINATAASIISRRREFALLQSVGMTGKQLRRALFFEGVLYTILTALFTLTAGVGLSWLIVRVMAGQVWFFKQSFTIMPSVASLVPLLVICAVVPLLCYAKLTRESLVERLRVE